MVLDVLQGSVLRRGLIEFCDCDDTLGRLFVLLGARFAFVLILWK